MPKINESYVAKHAADVGNPDLLAEYTCFRIEDEDEDRCFVYVTVEEFDVPRSVEAVYQARCDQLESAEANGDVVKVFKCEIIQFGQKSAVFSDVRWFDRGRTQTFDVVLQSRSVRMSLVEAGDKLDDVARDFSALARTVEYRFKP